MTDALTAWRSDAKVSRTLFWVATVPSDESTDALVAAVILCEAVATATHAATVAEYEAKLAAQSEAHCIRVVGDHLMPNDGGPCVICFPRTPSPELQ